MLVRFLIKNVLSFKEETVLDMVAINAYKEHESNIIDIGLKDKFLRVAAIYGANASGKSNLHMAMFYFQNIIVESLNSVNDSSTTAIEANYNPFSFEGEKEDSEFEITVIDNEFQYRYGFVYNDEYIVAEWLYRKNLKTNKTSIILERTRETVEFGFSIRKECEKYKTQIPEETLALTFFNKLKLKTGVFNSVYTSIMDILVAPPDFGDNPNRLESWLPEFIDNDEEKKELISFLSAIDTGIRNIAYENRENQIIIWTYHLGKDGVEYPLSLFFESQGTIKSIMLFIYTKMAIRLGKALVVDELNIRLHPLLLKFIIDLFYEKDSMAQLIYTTHDTTLMDKKFFRRDQIWFVQKDEFGYSELSALSDFKVRSDASFERDYLAGVYGGIPLLKEFSLKEAKE